MNQTSFSNLHLHSELLSNLSSLAYDEMTPIQAQSLPDILDGKDVIGQGKTGSGKTAAFGLGLLQKLDLKQYKIQALVLCPTRELADQVSKEIRRLARQLPNVKVIFNLGAGVDHLLLDDSLPPNIPIVRVVDDNLTRRMGEYVLLQVLYHLREMPKLRVAQAAHEWPEQYDPDAVDVSVGIMGLGEIGGHCAALVQQMGFKTLGWSNSVKNITGVLLPGAP